MPQTRVGTTLLWTEKERELATVLAERSWQAQNGDAVSASLGG
ncbi:hypothetical protein [Streptomyces sp. NPDC058985]